MQYWNIQLWENEDGLCRVDRDLLKKLRSNDPVLYTALGHRMIRYVKAPIQNLQAQQDLVKIKSEKQMWELKFHLGNKNEIRFLGCLVVEGGIHIFYALYAFRKKSQEIMSRHIHIGRIRIEEFIGQYTYNYGFQRIL